MILSIHKKNIIESPPKTLHFYNAMVRKFKIQNILLKIIDILRLIKK